MGKESCCQCNRNREEGNIRLEKRSTLSSRDFIIGGRRRGKVWKKSGSGGVAPRGSATVRFGAKRLLRAVSPLGKLSRGERLTKEASRNLLKKGGGLNLSN